MTLTVVTETYDPTQTCPDCGRSMDEVDTIGSGVWQCSVHGIAYRGDPTSSALPKFEGEEVHQLRAKLTSTTGLEVSDDVHRLDQTIAMVVTGRVVRVDHVVDERSGNLVRVETFKVVEATEIDWDDASGLLTDGDA